MKRFYLAVCYIALLAGMLLLPLCAAAEVVYLKSGQRMEGEIVFRNEEVVVLKDRTGARYQYRMTDVERIAAEAEQEKTTTEKESVEKEKKVRVALQLAGGAAVLPQATSLNGSPARQNLVGGTVQGDVVVGTANLFGRQILLGGAFGCHAAFLQGKTYTFLPIQIRAEVPLMQTKHAPMVALGAGYGISTTKDVRGGLFADLNIGWRCRLASGRALFLGAFTNMQNAHLSVTETLEGTEYTGEANRLLVHAGLKFGFYL